MRTRILVLTAVLGLLLPAAASADPHRPHQALQAMGSATLEGRDDEGSDDETTDEPLPFVEQFLTDPRDNGDAVVSGQPYARLEWNADEPAYPGDSPGSLSATYDAGAEAGLFGLPLPQSYDQDATFTAAAAFVIHSEGFFADPDGFFQISWGLWNDATTGLNRTGNLDDPADAFELIEFDYFPNVSPWFGGPFVAPTVLGAAAVDDPSFEYNGAFANIASLFDLQVDLPQDVPLLAVLEHRPELDSLTVQVYRIVTTDGLISLQGAVGPVSLDLLVLREYDVDSVGLTLWTDGWGGNNPAVTATLTYHAWIVVPGLVRPEALLQMGAGE
jgi:hypothetical protein